MDLYIYKIIEKTKSEGPGTRFCIWVQGCSRHCKGCYQKNTWDKYKGSLISTDEILTNIQNSKDIEGVTFLGGEPFEQAESLSKLALKIKELGLSVVTFTGNTYENLIKTDDIHIKKLLENTDLLIDGAFEKDKLDYSRPWVGSKNQRYIFLTTRYSNDDIEKYKNKVEIRISKSGEVFMNGMADFEKLLKLLKFIKK